MQFIFATHNANIPMLGDSERVLSCEFHETQIKADKGNDDLESAHKQIAGIMEGKKRLISNKSFILLGIKTLSLSRQDMNETLNFVLLL